jgi:hypothetical protein
MIIDKLIAWIKENPRATFKPVPDLISDNRNAENKKGKESKLAA